MKRKSFLSFLLTFAVRNLSQKCDPGDYWIKTRSRLNSLNLGETIKAKENNTLSKFLNE